MTTGQQLDAWCCRQGRQGGARGAKARFRLARASYQARVPASQSTLLGRRGAKSRQEIHGGVPPLDGQAAQRDCGNGPRRAHCGQEPAGRHAQGADYRRPRGCRRPATRPRVDLQAAPSAASQGQVGLHTRRPQSASTRRAYAPRLRARQAPRSASPPEEAAQEDPECRQGRMPHRL